MTSANKRKGTAAETAVVQWLREKGYQAQRNRAGWTDDHGDVEAVIRFVLRLAEEIDLTGLRGLEYALTCSRPRLDAFGGGAHVIDLGARKSIGWTSTQEWLAAALNGEDVNA